MMRTDMAEIKDQLPEYLQKAENDPRFLARIESARQSLHEGKGMRLEDIDN